MMPDEMWKEIISERVQYSYNNGHIGAICKEKGWWRDKGIIIEEDEIMNRNLDFMNTLERQIPLF